jgi:hypothetical protein
LVWALKKPLIGIKKQESNMKNLNEVKINNKIPRTMTIEGLKALGVLASMVPKNGIIVEIGPLYGSSTWVLSKNADPSVTIYSIDTWEDMPWISKRLPDAPKFSIDSFKKYISDCDNVIPIKGFSPDIVKDSWDRGIDMYFDDASHGNPYFIDNLNFFDNFINESAIICGDDYAAGWPDIPNEVFNYSKIYGQYPSVLGRLWSVVKSHNKKIDQYGFLSDKVQKLIFNAKTDHLSGETVKGCSFFWCGKPHLHDPITKFQIGGASKINGLSLICVIITQDNRQIQFNSLSGKNLIVDTKGSTIKTIMFSIIGPAQHLFRIRYQAGWVNLLKGKSLNNSKVVGGMRELGGDGDVALTSFRLYLEERK